MPGRALVGISTRHSSILRCGTRALVLGIFGAKGDPPINLWPIATCPASVPDDDALRLDIREAIVEALIGSAMARTFRELETVARNAIERGGGGVAPSRLRQMAKEVLERLEDEGSIRKNSGAVPSYELTPSGRARMMF
jgi:hypothetical protein